jgi:hypothetical protein
MRPLRILAIVACWCLLAGCQQRVPYQLPVFDAPKSPPKLVCPGVDLPAGYTCAPPLVCRDGAQWAKLDQDWVARLVVPDNWRVGTASVLTGLEQIVCGKAIPPAAVRG